MRLACMFLSLWLALLAQCCPAEWMDTALSSNDECAGEGTCSTHLLQVRSSSDLPPCAAHTPCPASWRSSLGGYHCRSSNGCRPAALGPFENCHEQCTIGDPRAPAAPAAPAAGSHDVPLQKSKASAALHARRLSEAGSYNLRMTKGGKIVGCASPVGLFAGNEKYGCGGRFRLKPACESAPSPIQETKYVAAVHRGCLTDAGMGTYGYAYDDGIGLKQCSPLTKYEWILCPTGAETGIHWHPETGPSDAVKRFRVTNKCHHPVWIQQAGKHSDLDPVIVKIESGSAYSYSIPNGGMSSMRYLPKTGCDVSGNGCDVQSIPPCPSQGCDIPIDTKFEASWGCRYTGDDSHKCSMTAQGHVCSYQDWWDGSAVDGWTLPFSVLVDHGGRGLSSDPNNDFGMDQCGHVICANLNASTLCPQDEFLTP